MQLSRRFFGGWVGEDQEYTHNLGQEFVIGGYILSNLGVDSLVVDFYRDKDFTSAARVRPGWFRPPGAKSLKRSSI